MSYAAKHNHANGEGNRDGSDYNLSANYGVEGPTDDPAIGAIRLRQSKNLLATLFLSLGTPLLLGGDERARTQRGNNNAYCHDNELSWFDCLYERHRNRRGTGPLLPRPGNAARRTPGAAPRRLLCTGTGTGRRRGLVRWFAPGGDLPDWNSPEPCLAACLMSAAGDLYLMLNAATGERPFAVPAAPHGGTWQRVIDTAIAAPDDISSLDLTGRGSDPEGELIDHAPGDL